LCNRIIMGEKVRISSMTGNTGIMTGEVVGVGSRIVAYPERLRKRPEIPLWGREIEVRISEDNPFLLGEKVMIQCPQSARTSLWTKLKGWWDQGKSVAAAACVSSDHTGAELSTRKEAACAPAD
jgi:hypothetical protein